MLVTTRVASFAYEPINNTGYARTIQTICDNSGLIATYGRRVCQAYVIAATVVHTAPQSSTTPDVHFSYKHTDAVTGHDGNKGKRGTINRRFRRNTFV